MCSQEQEQVEELKKKEAVLEKEKADVVRENKGLTEPLHEAQELVAELQRKLVNYYRDKEALMVSAQPCPFMGSFLRENTELCHLVCWGSWAKQILFCFL